MDIVHRAKISEQMFADVLEERRKNFKPFELDSLLLMWYVSRYAEGLFEMGESFDGPFSEERAVRLFRDNAYFFNGARLIYNTLLAANAQEYAGEA